MPVCRSPYGGLQLTGQINIQIHVDTCFHLGCSDAGVCVSGQIETDTDIPCIGRIYFYLTSLCDVSHTLRNKSLNP